jgi:hypothetical protein
MPVPPRWRIRRECRRKDSNLHFTRDLKARPLPWIGLRRRDCRWAHLRIARSAGSLSESPGQLARHDPFGARVLPPRVELQRLDARLLEPRPCWRKPWESNPTVHHGPPIFGTGCGPFRWRLPSLSGRPESNSDARLIRANRGTAPYGRMVWVERPGVEPAGHPLIRRAPRPARLGRAFGRRCEDRTRLHPLVRRSVSPDTEPPVPTRGVAPRGCAV